MIPPPQMNDTVVEPYSAVLSFHQLVGNADERFILDDQARYEICFRTMRLTTSTSGDLNHWIRATERREKVLAIPRSAQVRLEECRHEPQSLSRACNFQ